MILKMNSQVELDPPRRPDDRYRIGITGGIGTGKTYVANQIHLLWGIPVYDTDREAKRLMVESPAIREQLMALVGPEAYLPTGQLNRDVIAEFLFSSAENALKVNTIVHPVVRRDFIRWADDYELTSIEAELQHRLFRREVVAVESALLVEAHMTEVVDRVLQVTASLQTRLHRSMLRDGSSEQDVLERMAHQLTYTQRMPYVHHVIMNDEGVKDLPEQIERFINFTRKEADF